MKSSITVSIASLALLAGTAAAERPPAEPAQISVSGGVADQLARGTECTAGRSGPFCLGEIQHRLPGTAAFLAIGYTKRTREKNGWAFRFGPEMTASIVDGRNARASTIAGSMNVGFHLFRVMGETGLGVSMASFRGGDFKERGQTLFLHSGAGIEITRQWALTARADLHASGSIVVTTLGAGITFTPGR